MSEPDEDLPPAPEPSFLDTAVQDHPIAALLGAAIVGALLAKMVF